MERFYRKKEKRVMLEVLNWILNFKYDILFDVPNPKLH